MTADPLADFWQHDVSVERFTGTDAFGVDVYATAETVTGFVDDTRRLVRDLAGQEVVASTTVYLPAATADVPAGSKVTLPAVFGGRSSQVVGVSRHDAGSLPLPAHLELALR